MAGLRPIKFRLLELFSDEKEHWNYEIVSQVQKEYNMNNDYGRDSINFDIIELVSGGMLKSLESKVDEEGIYKKGFLLHKYMITDFGKVRASDACLEYV
jgi:pyruvate/oxaloacetate carboxyltransferase